MGDEGLREVARLLGHLRAQGWRLTKDWGSHHLTPDPEGALRLVGDYLGYGDPVAGPDAEVFRFAYMDGYEHGREGL